MFIEYTVLWLDVSVVDASLVEVNDGKGGLSEVVGSQRL